MFTSEEQFIEIINKAIEVDDISLFSKVLTDYLEKYERLGSIQKNVLSNIDFYYAEKCFKEIISLNVIENYDWEKHIKELIVYASANPDSIETLKYLNMIEYTIRHFNLDPNEMRASNASFNNPLIFMTIGCPKLFDLFLKMGVLYDITVNTLRGQDLKITTLEEHLEWLSQTERNQATYWWQSLKILKEFKTAKEEKKLIETNIAPVQSEISIKNTKI